MKFKVSIHDKEYEVGVQEVEDDPTISRESVRLRSAPRSVVVATETTMLLRRNNGGVTSPIPGIVASILVDVGSVVRKGDTLLVLEAMKMENDIMSTKDGIVTEIKVVEGQSVNAEETLLVVEYAL